MDFEVDEGMASNMGDSVLATRVKIEPIEPIEENGLTWQTVFFPNNEDFKYKKVVVKSSPTTKTEQKSPFIEIRKEDIDMIEKAANILEAKSRQFQPGIEYLEISDSPLSLVKNAKHAFEKAMASAVQGDFSQVHSKCQVKARTRLQNKFTTSSVSSDMSTSESDLNPSAMQINNLSLARPDLSGLGCVPSDALTASNGAGQTGNPSISASENNGPLDLTTSQTDDRLPTRQALSTSTVACDVLQAMVDCAADELAKAATAKAEEPKSEGKTIEIHLYSEPKSVIQHRNRCIKNGQMEKVKQDTNIGNSRDSTLTNIQWLGNMSGETLIKGQQGRRMFITEKQIQKVQKQCGSTERPPYSYLHLIQMAINSKPDRRMTLREIYDWMETTFPYFKHSAKPGWKNSIRHNLSLYDIFVRETTETGDGEKKKKTSYWTLKIADASDEADSENLDHEASVSDHTQSISLSAVRKYKSSRPVCQEAPPVKPMVYSDVVVGVPPSQQQRGHVPLLPKPSGDTYTLIPVQGMPAVPSTVHPILPSCALSSPNQMLVCEDSNSYQGMETSVFTHNTCVETRPTDFTQLKKRQNSSKQSKSTKHQRIFSPVTPGFNYNSSEYDSGIDLRSIYEKSSCSDFSPLPVENTRPKQKRAPRKPRQPRKSEKPMKVAHKENQKENMNHGIQMTSISCVDSGMVSSLESGFPSFTSPLRNIMNTPPRKEMLATSTPVKTTFLSPKWYSPVSFQTVTPVRNASLAMPNSDTLATPSLHHITDLSFGFSVSPHQNSPKISKMKGRSLGLNIGVDNSFTGMAGFTPLKAKDNAGNISGLSVNDSLGRILGDIQFDENFLEEGGMMPFVDVKDLSWLNH